MAKPTRKKSTAQPAAPLICNRCGAENPPNATTCNECPSTKFAPDWVIAKRPINRRVAVEITKPNPEFGTDPRITLSKWWPGGGSTYHIPTQDQWERIQDIITNDLGPILGWKATEELVQTIREKTEKAAAADTEIAQLAHDHPDIVRKLVGALDPDKLSGDDITRVLDLYGQIADALTRSNASFCEAFLNVVKTLPKQKQRALEDLEELLNGWSLQVVTNVAQQVRARIDTITLFEQQVQDDKTFEIRGDNSIHRIIERAMWLIDERYWLLQSNQTLLKFIGEAMSKKDKKKWGKKRPDFACGTVGDRLIILELKRPSHTLTVDDLNQLETYTVIAEEYKNFRYYEGYLIGTRQDDQLKRYLKRRSASTSSPTRTSSNARMNSSPH